ncbi:MAG: hypothetical protein I3J02_00225 [Prevotella sp.]|nr:hypothetical protein [Prevotella sp.]
MRLYRSLSSLFLLTVCLLSQAQTVGITTTGQVSARERFAAEYLQKKLSALGYRVNPSSKRGDYRIQLSQTTDTTGLKREGFTIERKGKRIRVVGNDGTGMIYGCNEIAEYARRHKSLDLPTTLSDAPEMVLRGACVGLQKTTYLPGHGVYEYPYTPDNFPWFYDKQQWIRYLDMLVDNRMNSLYLWNGHPFASLVRLKDYPFAVEVDSTTFRKNEEMFSFLTHEADKRGIFVIQMFYNIILSKPFADHYGIKTQDRNRPITPLVSDYTRKSIAAFIEKYPNVGLLVCLGEAMNTYEDDRDWFTQTIIPGVKDGLRALGRTDEPPLLLRAHDTDCKMVMDAALPLYRNLYTMHKYNGESLTTYEPRGPWSQIHQDLAALGSTHIENVHILANLEPWRWSSPDFVQKAVKAMHDVHHANALHLYPQASYWDWPYTADKLPDGGRENQLDRDWMWYQTWGRYAWNCRRDRTDEVVFWDQTLDDYYGPHTGDNIREAYEESGEIAPKLLRRFGITEGNRQTLLLGMFMSQLVNPYKYTIYPGFYESCGPEGEKLIEYVEKEWTHQAHQGELPLDIVAQTQAHGDRAVAAIDAVADKVTAHQTEFSRLRNDMHCYREFAYAFGWKVKAAQHILNYKWGKDINELEAAVPLLEQSLDHYRRLVDLTRDTYLYANSMQTAQRRIPIGGDGGHNKHWAELLPHYEQELANLKKNIALLKSKGHPVADEATIRPLHPARVTLGNGLRTVKLAKGVRLFSDMDSVVTAYAPELEGMQACVLSSRQQRSEGTSIEIATDKPVQLLVGYFRDDQKKYAQGPKLEVDASANDYGQAEPVLTSAIRIDGMPQVNVHAYHFAAGRHTLLLPKGFLLVLGSTADAITPHEVGLSGTDKAIDWLFY